MEEATNISSQCDEIECIGFSFRQYCGRNFYKNSIAQNISFERNQMYEDLSSEATNEVLTYALTRRENSYKAHNGRETEKKKIRYSRYKKHWFMNWYKSKLD